MTSQRRIKKDHLNLSSFSSILLTTIFPLFSRRSFLYMRRAVSNFSLHSCRCGRTKWSMMYLPAASYELPGLISQETPFQKIMPRLCRGWQMQGSHKKRMQKKRKTKCMHACMRWSSLCRRKAEEGTVELKQLTGQPTKDAYMNMYAIFCRYIYIYIYE